MSAPAAVSAASTTQNTHIEIPSFVALTENGNWGACGLIAEATALHVCSVGSIPLADRAATNRLIANWIYEYHTAINPADGQPRGDYRGVTTLGNIHWHLMLHAPHIAGYIPYSGTPNLTALHAFVKEQMLKQNPVIIQVSNAAALPHNESGIRYHFVVLGGIDSTLGYLVANGDTVEALTTTNFLLSRYWATWQQLVTAGICGAIALDRSWTPPAPPPPPPVTPPPVVPPVVPIGLADAIAQAEALVTALKAMEGPTS